MTDQVESIDQVVGDPLVPKLFKIVHADGSPPFVGRSSYSEFLWSMPKDDQPGEWMEIKGDLVACQRGLHLFDALTADQWIASAGGYSDSPLQVYEAEVEGEIFLHQGDKYTGSETPKWVARRARLVRFVGQLVDRNAEWTVDRTTMSRRYNRYIKYHNAQVFAKTPAWITSAIDGPGDRSSPKYWRLVMLLKAELKLERARMEVARLSGKADTANAKARRSALNGRSKQLSAYGRAFNFDAGSLEACAKALGVRLSKKRAERLKAARAARLERAKARIAVGVSAARLSEMVKEAAAA